MGYYARVRLEDTDGGDVWKSEGKASKVLIEAMQYLNKKDGKSTYKKIAEFLINDFKDFDVAMTKLFWGDKNGRE